MLEDGQVKEVVLSSDKLEIVPVAQGSTLYEIVPGGPTRSAPFGSLAPISEYFLGLWRKSTSSVRDSIVIVRDGRF